MRWEWLFADLEAQLEADERAGFEAELGDLVRAERATIRLCDRLQAHIGCDVVLHLRQGDALEAALVEVGTDWLLAKLSAGEALVPFASLVAVAGLSRSALAEEARPARGLRLSTVLRALAADRAPVAVELTGGAVLNGTIDRVFADHLDLAVHALDEVRRPESVTGVRAVPTGAIERITVP